MHIVVLIAGLGLMAAMFLDAFETILLPRRVQHRFRFSRLYYRSTWRMCRTIAGALPAGKVREALLGVFGPASMLLLFVSWVLGLIVGFAMLHWAIRSGLYNGDRPAPHEFAGYLYFSGTTFLTLGLGDIVPKGRLPHALTALEAGLGFGFLAILVSYLPVLYQAFSRREVTISLMDARAGSPPSGGEFLVRLARSGRMGDADSVLREWEQWAAELLESHISFPVLAYYRSQHSNQSWLAALATMLDSCALLLAWLPWRDSYQTQLTFAMARHAAVDIALIFRVRPISSETDRLNVNAIGRLQELLRGGKIEIDPSPQADARLAEIRAMYEPFLAGLAGHCMLVLPPIAPEHAVADNWQRSAWMPHTPGIGNLPAASSQGDHFD